MKEYSLTVKRIEYAQITVEAASYDEAKEKAVAEAAIVPDAAFDGTQYLVEE